MSGLSGSLLRFRGGFLHGDGIEWDADASDSMKEMPDGVVCLLIQGWNQPGRNRFDYFDVQTGKAKELDPEIEALLTPKGAKDLYMSLLDTLRSEGERLDASKCMTLCFAEGGFGEQFEALGVRMFLLKAAVNVGHAPSREFLWFEWSTNPNYIPADFLLCKSHKAGEGGHAGCAVL